MAKRGILIKDVGATTENPIQCMILLALITINYSFGFAEGIEKY